MLEYLAIPYSHKSEKVMNQRAELSNFIFSKLANEGRYFYAPISSCHHVAYKYGLPRDWSFWKYMDTEFVQVCGRLVVVKLRGWKTSTGLKAEIDIAKEAGVPVEYLDPTPFLIELGKDRRKRRIGNGS